MTESAAVDPALRPLTVPAAPTWSQVSASKQELAALRRELEALEKLAVKLESITDEPTWNAFIPFGPLAFFAGQLVHTNDINQTLPISPLPKVPDATLTSPSAAPEPSKPAEISAEEAGCREGGAYTALRSAKQARTSALQSSEYLKARLAQLEELIAKQEKEAQKEQAAQAAGGQPGSEDWSFNERGEVINEEGLPMFDIREELPAEPAAEPVTESLKRTVEEEPKQQMRYLIKKGGKQTVKPLNVPATAPAPRPSAPPITPSRQAPIVSSSAPQAERPKLDTKSILDELEKEEEAEKKRLEGERPIDGASISEIPSEVQVQVETKAAPLAGTASTASSSASSTASFASPAPTKKPGKQFGGFSAGFLSKKPATTPKASPAPCSSLSFPAPTACSTPASSPSATFQPLLAREHDDEPRHEPLHRVAPPPESIYRPTPPPTAPGTPRPSSPAPRTENRVKFDVPKGEAPGDGQDEPKKKRVAIPLPPPPTAEEKSAASAGKPKTDRPIKDKVVEREARPPVAPGQKRPKDPTSRSKEERDQFLKTMGRPPKVKERDADTQAAVSPTASTSSGRTPLSSSATPIHTISLSAKKPTSSLAGEISVTEIPSDEEDDAELDQPSLTSDGDSSSSGFYGSEDDDDSDEDFDIDAALHAREVALAYHDRRMGLGAGAGTGPLGGAGDPEAFDSWNQPEVPIDATLQGRPPSHGNASRFRTGRLESAQMIIPSLLAAHVREDGEASSDEEENEEGKKDGLTREERERLRISLKKLGRGEMPDPVEIGIGASEGPSTTSASVKGKEKAPPQIIATPIAVPANLTTRKEEADVEPIPAPAPVSPAERPKKMSRFKARQLGLEPEA